MTDRKTASTINDTELDQLYDELARAEAAITRVRELRDRWLRMTLEPGQVRRLLDDLTATLDQPAPATAATQTTDHKEH